MHKRIDRAATLAGLIAFAAIVVAVGMGVHSGTAGLRNPARVGSTPAAPTPPPVEFRGPAPAGVTVEGGEQQVTLAYAVTSAPISTAPVYTPSEPETDYARFRAALALSAWPITEWALVEARVACESSFDAEEDGDGGISIGLLMINTEAHPDLAQRYDLRDPVQNLDAGRIVEARHRAAGLPSPWIYCDRKAGR